MILRSSCVSLLITAIFSLIVLAEALFAICIWLSDSVIASMESSSTMLLAPWKLYPPGCPEMPICRRSSNACNMCSFNVAYV